ncbi:MAG: tyrosine-type recombinase/integrase [Planctomycetota bacterium]|nr:tyrosine-type recombinase/integrase [Planctomycetota bacterium]
MPSKHAPGPLGKEQDRLAKMAELDEKISLLQRQKQELEKATAIPTGTFEACLESYLSHIEVERGFSKHTIAAYRKDCRTFLDIFRLGAWLDRFLAEEKQASAVERNCEWFLRSLRKDRAFNIDQSTPGTANIDAFLDILVRAGEEKDQALLSEKELAGFLHEIKENGLEQELGRTSKALEQLVKSPYCETQRLPGERDIINFVTELRKDGLADSSVQRCFCAVRTFFKFLVREGVLGEDPSAELPIPRKGKYLPHVLGEEEVIRLLEAELDPAPRHPQRNRALLEILYASGLRVGEACGIQLGDVRPDLGIIKCKGKGQRERIVPTSKRCLAAIAAYCEDERPGLLGGQETGLLFLSRGGQELGREVVADIIRRYALAAGLAGKITPHTLRHSFATHLLRGGANLRIVQDLLGHKNVMTTEIYTHIERSELKELHRQFHPRG